MILCVAFAEKLQKIRENVLMVIFFAMIASQQPPKIEEILQNVQHAYVL